MRRKLMAAAAAVTVTVGAGTGMAAASGHGWRSVTTVNPAPEDLSSSPPAIVDITDPVACDGGPASVQFRGFRWEDTLSDVPGQNLETFVGTVRYYSPHKAITLPADYEGSQIYGTGPQLASTSTTVGSGPVSAFIPAIGLPSQTPGSLYIESGEATVSLLSMTLPAGTRNMCVALGYKPF